MILIHVDQRAVGVGKRKPAIWALLQQCEPRRTFRIKVDRLGSKTDVGLGNPVEVSLEGVELRHAKSDVIHSGLLDAPYYTRPAEYRGWTVPEVLLSGHHGAIAKHRRRESLRRTLERRPDLLERAALSSEDRKLLRELEAERRVTPEGGPP